MDYHHHYVDEVSGNVRNPQRVIDDRLSGNAQGIVLDVERSVVKSSWLTDPSGKYVYFALVYYPEEKIQKMRRLSKGAQVIASVARFHRNEFNIKVTEVNGVSVVLTSADIMICKRNRFSKAVSLFVWKVPSKIEKKYSVSIDPVKVCHNSANIPLPAGVFRKSLTDFLLGAKSETVVTLNGHDEIGRLIRLKIEI
jgi:hypothetical protein